MHKSGAERQEWPSKAVNKVLYKSCVLEMVWYTYDCASMAEATDGKETDEIFEREDEILYMYMTASLPTKLNHNHFVCS